MAAFNGAVSSLTNLANGMRRIYDEGTFEYAQNAASPLIDLFEEAKDLSPEGEGYFWPMMLRTPQNIATPAEVGNVPKTKQRKEVQGHVNAAQFVGTFAISFLLEAAGTSRGTWNKGEVKKHSFDTLTDLVKHRNRMYAGTAGDGVIAEVESARVVGDSNWTAKLTQNVGGNTWGASGQGALLLRESMSLEFYQPKAVSDAKIGTTVYDIDAIDSATRQISWAAGTTFADNIPAGARVVISKSFGLSTIPNGLMNLIDDGSFSASIHNVTRAGNAQVNSLVQNNGGILRELSEDMLLTGGFLQRQRNGATIDCLVMNTGQAHQFIRKVRPNRFQTTPGPTQVRAGAESTDNFKFYFDGRPVRIVVSEDIAPRHIYGIDLSAMNRVTLRKLGWLDHGGGSMFIQSVDDGGLMTARQATMFSLENIATKAPWKHIRWEDLADAQLCGTNFGGTDAWVGYP